MSKLVACGLTSVDGPKVFHGDKLKFRMKLNFNIFVRPTLYL